MSEPNDLSLYEDARDKADTGDCIVWNGVGLIPWLIRLMSPGANHTSTVYRMKETVKDRILIMESMLKIGWDCNFLSQRLLKYRGQAMLLRLKDEYAPLRPQIGRLMMSDALRTGYDLKGAIGNAIKPQPLGDTDNYCSESSIILYNSVGITDIKIAIVPSAVAALPIFKEPIPLL